MYFVAKSEGYWPEFRKIIEAGRVAGGQMHDARIAALCFLHGIREVWTADRDFTRFPGISVRNPLIS